MLARCCILLLLSATPVLAADPPKTAQAVGNVKEVIGHMGSVADRPGNTLAGIRRAVEAGAHAAEVDVRTTKDGVLVCLHDAEVDRTTDGTGKVADLTLAEIKKLDAGVKFDAKFKGERVPTLREVLELAKGRIGVMIDLKEDGEEYAKRIAAEVRAHGDPWRLVLGVRSVGHAEQFRTLLPMARQIGLVPTPADIEPFAKAGVPVIRLWPKWLADESLVPRVRKLGLELHLGTGAGTKAEVLPLLAHTPESLASDDPAQLFKTLADLAGMTVRRDIAYADPKAEKQRLDVYSPAGKTGCPVVVWIHGGGWHSGDKKEVDAKPPAFAARGLVFVSVNYRLFPAASVGEMAGDVAKAVRWVRDHIKDHGGDPDRLVVTGHSAGAQLAALVCTDDRYLKAEGLSLAAVKGCVPVDGDSYDVPLQIKTVEPRRADIYRKKFGDGASQAALSAVTHVARGKHIPPVLVLHVADHPEVTMQSERLVKVLADAGVPATAYPAANTNHVKLNADLGRTDDRPTREMFEFIDRVLKK